MPETRYFGTVGTFDRVLRAIVGIVLVGFALACPWAASLGLDVQWASGVIGGVLIATAAIGFCPIYRMLKICS